MRDLLLPPLLVALLIALPAPAVRSAPPDSPLDPKAIEFFEKKIRPLLAEHCYACHSTNAAAQKKLKGGLLLDTRDGVRAGGDSGRIVVPGKPADSLLIEALRYDGDLKMPPKGKLPAAA